MQNTGFQQLVSELEPWHEIISEKFYQTELFPITYKDVQKKIMEFLSKEGGSISFTIDCWSGTTESIVSLTTHLINTNWEKNDIYLKAMEGSHTGECLASTFMAMLEDWQISEERVFMILRKSGINMVKRMNLVELPNLSCFAIDC